MSRLWKPGDPYQTRIVGQLVVVREGDMWPLDEGRTLPDLLRMLLHNLSKYQPQLAAAGMTKYGPTARALSEIRPLNRLYRLKGGYHSGTTGVSPLGVIVGYRDAQRGSPPLALTMVLGLKTGPGSPEKPFLVPAEGLEDVTERGRCALFEGADATRRFLMER